MKLWLEKSGVGISCNHAAAFVGPIFLTLYMGLGLIWSGSSMGQPMIALEDHIRLNMPSNSKRLTFWEFLNVANGPLL